MAGIREAGYMGEARAKEQAAQIERETQAVVQRLSGLLNKAADARRALYEVLGGGGDVVRADECERPEGKLCEVESLVTDLERMVIQMSEMAHEVMIRL